MLFRHVLNDFISEDWSSTLFKINPCIYAWFMPIPIREDDRGRCFDPVNYCLFPSFYIDFDFFNLLLSSLSCCSKSWIIADLKEFVYEFWLKFGEHVISSTTYGLSAFTFDLDANWLDGTSLSCWDF